MSVWRLVKFSIPLLKTTPWSNIVFLSSVFAYDPQVWCGLYSISKAMITSLSKLLANEFAQSEFRANCVAPGFVKSPFMNKLFKGDLE